MAAILRLVIGLLLTRVATRGTAARGAPWWLGLVRMLGVRRALPIAVAVGATQYLSHRRRERAARPRRWVSRPALPAPGPDGRGLR